ncbi:fumarylacetoacetase [Cupriavidus sp. WKF15]|uniref:fumarylacetoacetase n=1 Tax=Cupriavidus sp. WKF15 TaxID=3032282 RepID=UPI0023E09C45|nr:fumarylacetoacetase [Cupriavidus sp. WKF15]WER47625.1 fumarylacetoacetase [Cupriavidus sp. WKF15]
MRLNETHGPDLRSFVSSANDPATEFPIQNLPLAIFRRRGANEPFRVGTGIGDQVLDIAAVQELFDGSAREAARACGEPSMNALMDLGPSHWSALRLGLSRILRDDSQYVTAINACLTPIRDAEFGLPAKIGNFSDYAASLHHVSKVTKIARPENPELDPNLVWSPIAYHHRPSTIRPHGHGFLRPKGQLGHFKDGKPVFGPSEKMDYEAELGIYIAKTTDFGKALSLDEAEEAIFGLTVLNDWTARDIMFWERLPLGPFLSKSFDTTVSPWVVTMEALEPFRRASVRSAPYPDPLPNLDSAQNRERGALDVHVEVLLQTEKGEASGFSPVSLSLSNTRDMYWTVSQLVAHQTSAGCNLEQGDLIGTGTISGPAREESGCMFELTLGGQAEVDMPTGERRGFVEDGDTLIVRAYCKADGFRKIGFGDAGSTVLPNT